jgi:uncharacterized membrane protein
VPVNEATDATSDTGAAGATNRPAGFRERGGDISRVEGFADCAFGFAVTLLVVSLEVPKTFDGLVEVLHGIPSFALSFSILAWIWFTQFRFFRRYGLEDVVTVLLTLVLLFVVLCYVYPLKFLYAVSLGGGDLTEHDLRVLFVIYGVGLATVFVVLALMFANAYRQRDRLGLDELERADTRIHIAQLLGVAAIGLLSAAVAMLPVPDFGLLAGFTYFLNAVVYYVGGRRRGALRRAA